MPSALTSKDNVMRQSSSELFFPPEIQAPAAGWYFFPCANPISSPRTLSCYPDRGRGDTKPKPFSSRSQACLLLAHFITPVIRPVVPHRTTCPVPSFPNSCQSLIQSSVSHWGSDPQPGRPRHVSTSRPGKLHQCGTPQRVSGPRWHPQPGEEEDEEAGGSNGGMGDCGGRSWRMRDIHTNTNQMQGWTDG